MQAIDWLARRSLYHPDKLALVDGARRFTFGELEGHAARAAHLLQSLGVRPGDRVGLLSANSAEVLFVFFGASKLGAIFLPLNFRLAIPELLPIVEQAQPSLVIHSEEFGELARALPDVRLVELECFARQMQAQPDTWGAAIPVDERAPQMLLFTSGTTGKPKGAILPHRMIVWNAINFCLRDLLASDTVLVHSPVFYTAGLNVYTLPALFAGGTVVLMRCWNAEEALELIERERVTVLFGVPTQLLMLTELPRFASANLTSLRYVISGGAPCPAALIERLVARGLAYKQGMGLTEVGPNCFALEARDALRKAGSIGFPNLAIEARIVDQEGRDLGPDQVGELVLRTPAMCSGYWRNPEATAAAIRQGWFHTGDLARRDAEGYFYIVDRKKDMYISGGENVYPAEVEQVLARHPQVEQVAVIGVPHAKWGEVGCAVIVGREAISEEEILKFCRGKLAKFKIPKSVRFVRELPRTHSGKVQKQKLRARIAAEHL